MTDMETNGTPRSSNSTAEPSAADIRYMRRALHLAALSPYDTHPNPMVGAVIVAPDGRIIGEGWHRRCGEGHAEVNAVASVAEADRPLLKESTIYVTLEPCSHYGKTPPCAKLLVDTGFRRAVVGAVDPFPAVAGRGLEMLKQGGLEVEVGVLADESRTLNHRFFTAHTSGRPYITLKWAQSADGYLDAVRELGEPAYRFSTDASLAEVHRLRALHDAILTSGATVIADNPRLDVRLFDGPSPRRVVVSRSTPLPAISRVFGELPKNNLRDRRTLLYTALDAPFIGSADEIYALSDRVEVVKVSPDIPIEEIMGDLYARGITSVLIEAGPRMLHSFLDAKLYDDRRVEVAPIELGTRGRAKIF